MVFLGYLPKNLDYIETLLQNLVQKIGCNNLFGIIDYLISGFYQPAFRIKVSGLIVDIVFPKRFLILKNGLKVNYFIRFNCRDKTMRLWKRLLNAKFKDT